jgi:hypothetical protein
MPRMDAVVLGAGIVGTSIALHLVKRGLAVALMDRRAPGEETSYGNAGVIEGNTVFPPAFPSDPVALLRIALKRAPEANYHLTFLPHVAPWLLAFHTASHPKRLLETACAMRPLFARAVAEHEALLAEAGASRYLRKEGWLKLYRSERAFAALKSELALAQDFGIPHRALTAEAACGLEPSLAPVFRHAVHWQGVASVSNPLAVTQAYAARFAALGGVVMRGDARSLHRATATGGSTLRKGRSTPRRRWWRSGRSPPMCSLRSGSSCRLASSAATIATIGPRAMPRWRGRWSIPRSATASRQWSRASALPPGRNSPRATRRRRRCSSIACCRPPRLCSRSASRWRLNLGWAAGRAFPTRGR